MKRWNCRFFGLLRICSILIALLWCANHSFAQGNEWNQSFSKAKKTLETQVYLEDHERTTLYCHALFDKEKHITLPQGFSTEKYVKRASSLEWEHVVPAENFGRAFEPWREGDPLCVDSKGKSFKGRKCAEKVDEEYRYMQADMHNLYPSIGAVNASRSNYNFTVLPDVEPCFGMCPMKISGNKAEPPAEACGQIARAYLYMEKEYPIYKMSSSQRKLMNAWNKMYPVTQDECTRAFRISCIQGNTNCFVEEQCVEMNVAMQQAKF